MYVEFHTGLTEDKKKGNVPNLFHYRFSFSIGLAHAPTEQFHLCVVI